MYQVAGSVYERNGVAEDMVVGITSCNVRRWAQSNYLAGKKFVEAPTIRTTACRCVIMAIRRGLEVNNRKAFGFKIFVRTYLLAGNVKGKFRSATECIKKGE